MDGEHEIVRIARCLEHGLHGAREECFVCGKPVEQIPMLPVAAVVRVCTELEELYDDPCDSGLGPEHYNALSEAIARLAELIGDRGARQ